MTMFATGVFQIASFSVLGAMLSVFFLGPPVIVLLRRYCTAPLASDSETLNRLHFHKSTTPTMGGLFVVAGLGLPLAVFAFHDLAYFAPALVLLFGLTVVGTLDDSLKIRRHGKGVSARGKLLGQTVVALFVATLVYIFQLRAGNPPILVFPFLENAIPLGINFIPWMMLVIIATSNAVNLTDGLDGLASGCLAVAAGGMGLLAYATYHATQSPNAASAVLLAGALVGASAGFLHFNRHPAMVFLGDAGSLPLGGLLGYLAITIHQEFTLLLIGGVFVAETLSVILQVASYRLTGKRILRCAPLHHHFRFGGWSESKTVYRFWTAGIIFAIVGLMLGWLWA